MRKMKGLRPDAILGLLIGLIIGGVAMGLSSVLVRPAVIATPTPAPVWPTPAPTRTPYPVRWDLDCQKLPGTDYEIVRLDGSSRTAVSNERGDDVRAMNGTYRLIVENEQLYLEADDQTPRRLSDWPTGRGIDVLWGENRLAVTDLNRLIIVDDYHSDDMTVRRYPSPGRFHYIESMSPDDRYIVFRVNGLHQVWDAELRQDVPGMFAEMGTTPILAWTPDSTALAGVHYAWGTPADQSVLTVLEVATDRIRQQNIDGLQRPLALRWSADGEQLAAVGDADRRTATFHQVRTLIYARDLTAVEELDSFGVSRDVFGDVVGWWHEDAYIYTALTSTGFTLRAFGDADQTAPLTSSVDRLPLAGRDFITTYEADGPRKQIIIRNRGAQAVATLIDNVEKAGSPDWSPGGAWVAATWANGDPPNETWGLAVYNPHTGQRHDIRDDALTGIADLLWAGEQALFFRADNAVALLDLETGEVVMLGQNLVELWDYHYVERAGEVRYWWRDSQGTIGQDAYAVDGTRVYRIITGQSSPLTQFTQLYWSPNREAVAIKSRTLNVFDQELLIAYADGRPARQVRKGLSGLGEPLWSPDGSMLFFSENRNETHWQGPVHFSVVTNTGDDVFSESVGGAFWGHFGWGDCA